jgi:hypothetical protein
LLSADGDRRKLKGDAKPSAQHHHPLRLKGRRPMSDNPSFHNASLLSALSFISSRPDHYYPSPKFQPKRASVALIIWIKPPQTHSPLSTSSQGIFGLMLQSSIGLVKTLSELFSQSWVQQGEPQVLFIKRAKRTGDRWSAHVALPGISGYLEILT